MADIILLREDLAELWQGCNRIHAEVTGPTQPRVKLTVQGHDYPDRWIRIPLPSTLTSRRGLGMSHPHGILSRRLPGINLTSPSPFKTPEDAETLLQTHTYRRSRTKPAYMWRLPALVLVNNSKQAFRVCTKLFRYFRVGSRPPCARCAVVLQNIYTCKP